jgi:hypothetical protein
MTWFTLSTFLLYTIFLFYNKKPLSHSTTNLTHFAVTSLQDKAHIS